ncbi:hypothetical protein B0H34DRAFT_800543 [Crassisporium funariophilum]|nr:hypothetical protein B0H34DRAFT_800543 [Crassisporium funariophilum]
MSPRTVSRVMLEAYIAGQTQIASEFRQAQALTLSADSTSNRGVNFESCHIAMRTADYKSGNLNVNTSATPKIRLLAVDSTVDHSAETSVNGILKHVRNTINIFN